MSDETFMRLAAPRKKGILALVFSRFLIVGILLVLQVLLYVLVFTWLNDYFTHFYILTTLFTMIVVLYLFSSDMDAVTAMTLDRGRKNNQLLIQPQYSPMPVGEQIAILYCGVHGLMRDVPIDKVRQCQTQFLDKLRSSAPEVIETLGAGKLDDATTDKIEAIMADIAGTYK